MRGATPSPISLRAGHATSIHAPHAWGDSPLTELSRRTNTLQSTPHMRGATSVPAKYQPTSKTSIHAPHAWGDYLRKNIDFDRAATSIHAPHAWGDLLGGFMGKNYTDFNPRPTCVGRLGTFMATPMTANFNPRPTCVGRRKLSSRERVVKILQSTPHMRGATSSCLSSSSASPYFNPRPTCVGRPRLRPIS